MLRKGNPVLISSIMLGLHFINRKENSTVSTFVEIEPILCILILQYWVSTITFILRTCIAKGRQKGGWILGCESFSRALLPLLGWLHQSSSISDSLGWNYCLLLLHVSKVTFCVSNVNLVISQILIYCRIIFCMDLIPIE